MVTPEGENDGILEAFTASEILENVDVIMVDQNDVPDEEKDDGSALVQPHPKEVVQQNRCPRLGIALRDRQGGTRRGGDARSAAEGICGAGRAQASLKQASLKQASIQDFFPRAPNDV